MREKNHKKAFGLLGLATVASMTTVAASLPTPDAGAASTVSDIISVRVVSERPSVSIVNFGDNAVVSTPQFDLKYTYDNLEDVAIKVRYINSDGEDTTYLLTEEDLLPADVPTPMSLNDDLGRGDASDNTNTSIDPELGIATGFGSFRVDLTRLPKFGGYGYYTFYIYGEGLNSPVSDSVRILYAPISFDPEETPTKEEDGGNPIIKFDTDENSDIGKVEINIKDKDGNTVNDKPIVCTNLSACEVPFSDYQAPSGDYTLEITAYDKNGNKLDTVANIKYKYTVSQLNPEAPKTGGQPGILNVAKEDFVATALVIFGLALIASFVLLKKRSRR